ncbi:uncharacterized protein LOC110234365 [Exaiptasia diaphana]|uniref:Uncharacterized protein n=1 Tax=Exaiptasia diaphana TaxID=2652724 RepID=A0A913WWY3_EXADI|nr:uncharacterized protein LOC110234365 [Exaiptasia diaphana]KXJ27713.1 hypothetical protein AC249_AIPGENE16913 [Exaiptasia diaphana]
MADSETSPSSSPLYHEVDPRITLGLRIYAVLTAFLVFLTLIFCFVKGAEDSNMYLLAVNMILSSLIGAVLAWWYRKGIIEADKKSFLVLLGICIIFQAIISDIYVYHKPEVHSTPVIIVKPTNATRMSSIGPTL